MDSSPGFASAACDSIALLKARFRCGSRSSLNLAAYQQLAGSFYKRHAVTPLRVLRLLVGARFQVLFHSPLGVLFTFPSRYWFAIGHRRVFRLGGWSPQVRTGFHVPGATQAPHAQSALDSRTGLSPCCGRPSHAVPLPTRICNCVHGRQAHGMRGPTTPSCSNALPACTCTGLASVPFRSPLLGESRIDFSLLRVLRCFSSPGCLLAPYVIQARVARHDPCWVPPFGDPRVEGRVRLTGAYRSLPRPSSASCAKASAVRP